MAVEHWHYVSSYATRRPRHIKLLQGHEKVGVSQCRGKGWLSVQPVVNLTKTNFTYVFTFSVAELKMVRRLISLASWNTNIYHINPWSWSSVGCRWQLTKGQSWEMSAVSFDLVNSLRLWDPQVCTRLYFFSIPSDVDMTNEGFLVI